MASLKEHRNHFHKVNEETVFLNLTRAEICTTIYGVAMCRDMIDDGKHPIFHGALEDAYNTLELVLDGHKLPESDTVRFTLKRGMLCNVTRAILGYADVMRKQGRAGRTEEALRAVWQKLHEQRERHEQKAIKRVWRS